ncbi:hypothetical protein ACU8MP_05625 [Rhizobium leguminosarum]
MDRGVAFCDWAMVSALSGFIKRILEGAGNCLCGEENFEISEKTMLAYGFQLVNGWPREMNIFGVNGSKREISERWRISSTVEPAADGVSVIL